MVGGARSRPKKRSFQSFKDVSVSKNGNADTDKRSKAADRRIEISSEGGREDKGREDKNKSSVKRVVSKMSSALNDQTVGDFDRNDRSFYKEDEDGDENDENDDDIHTPKRHRSSSNWTILAGSEPANSPSPIVTPSLPQRHPQRLDAGAVHHQTSSVLKGANLSPLSIAASDRRRQQQKRRQQYPGKTHQQQEQQQLDRVRAAKFHEASMHDRPSEKPPSMFTRMPADGAGRSMADLATDRLMEQYYHQNRIGRAGDVVLGHGSGSGQILGHAYGLGSEISGKAVGAVAAAPIVNNSGCIDSSITEKNKQSGLFRFGKTFASTFNPVQIWQRVATNWKEAKEEVFQEEREAAQAEMEERRIRAEREYAALKKDNRLASLGTHALPTNAKVYAPGYTSGANISSIEFDIPHELRRSSMSSVNSKHQSFTGGVADGSASIPPRYAGKSNMTKDQQPSQTKKSAFHFRTPSISDLKKIQSDIHLRAKRSISESLSPEKHAIPSIENNGGSQIIRKIHSRKELIRQQRLSKRVSNLESKLAEAKRDLKQSLTGEGEEGEEGPPAVQVVPDLTSSVTARTTSASASLLSLGPGSAVALQRTASPPKKLFVPGALPTLPSERLLNLEQLDSYPSDSKSTDDTIEMPSSPGKSLSQPEKDSLITDVGAAGEFDSIASSRPSTPVEDVSTNEMPSPDTWRQETNGLNAPGKQCSRNNVAMKRKAHNQENLRNKENDERNTLIESQSASQRMSKRKTVYSNPRGKITQSGSPRSQQLSKRPSNLDKESPRKLLKPIPERISNELPTSKSAKLRPSTSALFSGKFNQKSDENEPWETENPVQSAADKSDPLATTAATMMASRSKFIALANVPTNPTAVATPAHPSLITHSPLLSSPRKRSMPSFSVSESPVKSSPRKVSKFSQAVPKMPTMLQENGAVGGIGVEEVAMRQSPIKKEHWEWPEDVF